MLIDARLKNSLQVCFLMRYRMIDHTFFAQNFKISTCFRYVDKTDFVNFLEEDNRYKVEIIKVN